jgi:hypothetical protein
MALGFFRIRNGYRYYVISDVFEIKKGKSASGHFIRESVSFENLSLKHSHPLPKPYLNKGVIRDEIRFSS